jgi:hypothetical protein
MNGQSEPNLLALPESTGGNLWLSKTLMTSSLDKEKALS